MLDAEPVPIEMVRGVLDEAAGQAPDDDRVWLGRANLATWSGRFDEADRWLSACLGRRPTTRPSGAPGSTGREPPGEPTSPQQALAHLPADRIDPAEVLELHAWFAGRRGDREAERLALEHLIEQAPGDSRALERLATLAVEAGQADRAGELRRRKADVDQARERYRKLLAIDATTVNLPTVARLAETLGRWFEARGWWSLVLRQVPDDREARAALDRLARRADSRPPGLIARRPHRVPRPHLRGRRGPPRRSSPPSSPTTPRRPGSGSPTTTAGPRPASSPRPWAAGSACSTTTATAGSTSTASRAGRSRPEAAVSRPNGDRLFRNRGDGTFEDVTRQAGLAGLPGGYGHGVAVGDYDNDGRPDLFVTRWRSYALYRNRGDGTFEDVTEAAGLGGDRDWPTSAAFADLDGDGDLDLYVCHYLAWDAEHPPLCRVTPGTAEPRVLRPSRASTPLPDHLFRNDGGRFVDVTAEAGIVDRDGRGLGVVAADLDGDGRVDLYVANDTTANLPVPEPRRPPVRGGRARLRRGGQRRRRVPGGHGGRLRRPRRRRPARPGRDQLLRRVDHLLPEPGRGHLRRPDRRRPAWPPPSRSLLGFGVAFLDSNNDGRLDLATANGHVNDLRPTFPYAMPAQLLAGARGAAWSTSPSRPAPPGRSPASAAGWPSATSTTTAGSTS